MKFCDFERKVIELPPERWKHITTEHPEVKKLKNKIKEVLRKPDIVKGSKRDKNVWLYYKFSQEIFGGKYLLVVVKKGDKSFILTFYITDRIKKGDFIWKKEKGKN